MRPVDPALVIQGMQRRIGELEDELRRERIIRHQRGEPILCAVIDTLNGLAENAKRGHPESARLLAQFYEALDAGRAPLSGIQVPTAAEARRLQG